jgi:hypothetical protein
MHLLTRESARAAKACYTDERIAALVPPEGLTPAQVAVLPVPAPDRFWALNRACGATPREQREQACRCARRALERERAAGREPDARSWSAVEVAERYARGEATGDELRVAASAAYAAAAYAAAAYADADADEREQQVREYAEALT